MNDGSVHEHSGEAFQTSVDWSVPHAMYITNSILFIFAILSAVAFAIVIIFCIIIKILIK